MDLKEYIDPEQWQMDQSPDFTDGQGYWAKVANAVIEGGLLPNLAGEAEILIRVRTGGSKTNPTDYIPSYRVEVDGVVVPMALDTTRQNIPSSVYGGCHLGYIKGRVNLPDTKAHAFKFISTRMYAGIDGLYFIDASTKQAYDQGLADGSKGMYTQADMDKAKADAKAQGITEGKQTQRTADVKESQAKYKDVTVRQYAPLE
jgi:hypothetical protein